MENRKYRILESRGEFIIQTPHYLISKSLWGITRKEIWLPIRKGGAPDLTYISLRYHYSCDPLPSFKTLDEARSYAKILMKEDVIHEVEDCCKSCADGHKCESDEN